MDKKFNVIIFALILTICLVPPAFSLSEDHTIIWSSSEGFTYTNNQRSIARDSEGKLHCVYNRGHIYYSYSTNDGETWTEEQVSSGGGTHYYPALALDSQDNIHVVWYGGTTNKLHYRVRSKAGIWSAQQGLPNVDTHQKCPALAVDSKDNIHVVWMANENRIRYSVKTGSGWLPTPEEVTDGANSYQICPAIAMDPWDNIHVTWSGKGWGSNPGTYNIYYKKKPDGGAWESLEYVTDTDSQQGFLGATYMGPSIAIDSMGNPHVAWTGLGWGVNPSDYNIQYRSQTSGTWLGIKSITDIDTFQLNPVIALDTCDNVHIIWSGKGWGNDPGNSSILSIEKRKEWGPIEILAVHSQEVSGLQGYPRLPNTMWAMHPRVSEVRPNIPDPVLSVIYMDERNEAPEFRIAYLEKKLVLDCRLESVGGELTPLNQHRLSTLSLFILTVASIVGLSILEKKKLR
jgi:hypothetical protein